MLNVNRIEIISKENGREFVIKDIKVVESQLQDNERTLKLIVQNNGE